MHALRSLLYRPGAVVAGLSLITLSGSAAATEIDVSSVTTAIAGAATPIASIGAAVLLVLVGVKVYKWIRRAL